MATQCLGSKCSTATIALAIAAALSASTAISLYFWRRKCRGLESKVRELQKSLKSSSEKCGAERQGRIRAQQIGVISSTVVRRSYAATLKTGHASRVQSEGNGESGLQITPQNHLVVMHNSLKEMETQFVELKTTIAFLSTKIDLLLAGGNMVVRNKTKIGPNLLNSDKGKQKIGFGPVPITRSRRVWRVKRKSGLFEAGSTSGIGVETSVMECHLPWVTHDRPIVGITPLVPEETMAPSSELKENGVLPRFEGDVGSAEVAHKGSPEVKGLSVPHVDECTMSVDNVAPLVSLPPIADWILPKVNEIQQFVGISHGGCEDQFNELITAIEASHALETKSFKKSRELQRLFSTINYDAKGDSSTRGKSKGRTL